MLKSSFCVTQPPRTLPSAFDRPTPSLCSHRHHSAREEGETHDQDSAKKILSLTLLSCDSIDYAVWSVVPSAADAATRVGCRIRSKSHARSHKGRRDREGNDWLIIDVCSSRLMLLPLNIIMTAIGTLLSSSGTSSTQGESAFSRRTQSHAPLRQDNRLLMRKFSRSNLEIKLS